MYIFVPTISENSWKIYFTFANSGFMLAHIAGIFFMVIHIPHIAISGAMDRREIKILAVFYCLKSLHSNSCLYINNTCNLSKITGLSRTAIKRYINIFKDNGWVREHCGNIT